MILKHFSKLLQMTNRDMCLLQVFSLCFKNTSSMVLVRVTVTYLWMRNPKNMNSIRCSFVDLNIDIYSENPEYRGDVIYLESKSYLIPLFKVRVWYKNLISYCYKQCMLYLALLIHLGTQTSIQTIQLLTNSSYARKYHLDARTYSASSSDERDFWVSIWAAGYSWIKPINRMMTSLFNSTIEGMSISLASWHMICMEHGKMWLFITRLSIWNQMIQRKEWALYDLLVNIFTIPFNP